MNANQRIKKIEKIINTRIGQEDNKPMNFYDIDEADRELILKAHRRAREVINSQRICIDGRPEVLQDICDAQIRLLLAERATTT